MRPKPSSNAVATLLMLGVALAAAGPNGLRELAAVSIGVAVCVFGVGAIRRNGGESKLPWVIVHIGATGMLVSFVVRGIDGSISGETFAFPSVADLIALPAYALLISGEFALVRARRDRTVRANTLDALIVAAAFGFGLWVLLIAPIVADESLAVTARLLDAVYSFLDIALVATTALLAFGPGRRNRTYRMLAGSIGVPGGAACP